LGHVTIKLSNVLAVEAGSKKVEVEASNLGEALSKLTEGREGLKNKLLDDLGRPRVYVNIYVNGKDYRFLQLLNTTLSDEDNITIIPAVSGG